MASERWVLTVAIALPFLVALLTPLIYRLIGEATAYVGALVAGSSFVLIASQHGSSGTVAYEWIPSMDVALRLHVDAWAMLFGLLASGIGALIFTYSAGYMRDKSDLGRFYMALLAFMGSILGVAFAGDLIVLFVFWELTSVCSFVLIGYHTTDPDSQYSARMALVVTAGGGLCLLLAIVFLAIAPGGGSSGFDLSAMLAEPDVVSAQLEAAGLFVPVLVLVTLAAAAKSAQVPLHFWLPRAMVAPTPVSAFLHSATMVKVGVYFLGRVRPVFVGPEWLVVVATLGLVTMLVAAILAVLADDVKELLAYSTASHLGLMVAGFGFTTHYGAAAGVFHLLNHALFKAALFMVAGILIYQAGTGHMDRLGGLWRDLPVTAAVTVIAAGAMAGLPPTNGFYSKELLFEGAWEVARLEGGLAWLFPTCAVIASVFTIVYSIRFLWLFFGEKPQSIGVQTVSRPSPALLFPAVVLAALAAIFSLAPQLAMAAIVDDGVAATTVGPVDVYAGIPTSLSGPVLMSLVTIAVGLAAATMHHRVRAGLAPLETLTRRMHPERAYDVVLAGSESASARLHATVHTEILRTYVVWVLAGICSLTLASFLAAGVNVSDSLFLQTPPAMILVLGVAVVAGIAVTTTETHVTGVLTLGILGFMVAIFFILASGPDLALTQLIVETLLVLVFLLVLEQLPAYYDELSGSVVLRDATLSLVVGVTAAVALLVAAPGRDGTLSETARFYVENAVPGGGGTNVVNVILTDFRALDTLGEGIVVLIAALSVFVLLGMRRGGETK